jgi:hypothetical protein
VNADLFQIFPSDRLDKGFPWEIWAVGWLAFFKAILWISYEPILSEAVLHRLATKYLVELLPLIVCGIGIWNHKRWAVWGLIIVAVANLIFFVVYPETLKSVIINSEVRLYSVILSAIAWLFNGPLGDVLILFLSPVLFKHTR